MAYGKDWYHEYSMGQHWLPALSVKDTFNVKEYQNPYAFLQDEMEKSIFETTDDVKTNVKNAIEYLSDSMEREGRGKLMLDSISLENGVISMKITHNPPTPIEYVMCNLSKEIYRERDEEFMQAMASIQTLEECNEACEDALTLLTDEHPATAIIQNDDYKMVSFHLVNKSVTPGANISHDGVTCKNCNDFNEYCNTLGS